MQERGAEVYRRLAITTAPPARVTVMLYRQAIQSIQRAVEALQARDLEAAHNDLVRAGGILFELQSALNRDADSLAADLDALYGYMRRSLVDANLRKDPAPAVKVAELLDSLLRAWEESLRSSRK